ncbi:Glycoside hydrolase family 17, F-box domain-containing protein [Thalictrum thalictroides]|uniref:Glycoside hydrolase family 17, F-box domain-containing protein n=1 Tax=Thalictrum thalictroides TaxID=46969 RepID=A0A7J6WJ25_THATH|nr:Glycoside hydrolase family 17, F-box domain-containing protein [Thalictrum thalictroides]
MAMEQKTQQGHGELAKEQIIENNNTQLVSNHVEPSRQKAAIKKKNKRIEKNMKRYQMVKKSGESSVLPMPLIYDDILIRIPPEALLQNFRYVCHEWLYKISTQDFAQRNLPYSRPKFILLTTRYHFFGSKESKFEIFDMKEDKLIRDCSMGRWKGQARNSCRGLILVADENKKLNRFHVFNPLTMKLTISLPQCPSTCPHEDCTAWLAFDSSNNVFKVVHMYADQFGYEIWSLGIDTKWRVVPGPFEDIYDRPFNPGDFAWGDPIAVNDKVLHWNVNQARRYIISMDVTDELARKTSIPDYDERKPYELIEMGGNLGIMFIVSDSQKDIWILKDFQSEKWVKIHSIVSSSIQSSIRLRPRPQLHNLIPVLSLGNGEVILFKSSKKEVLYAYELKSSTLKMLNINFTDDQKLIVHVNSLISCDESQDSYPDSSNLARFNEAD